MRKSPDTLMTSDNYAWAPRQDRKCESEATHRASLQDRRSIRGVHSSAATRPLLSYVIRERKSRINVTDHRPCHGVRLAYPYLRRMYFLHIVRFICTWFMRAYDVDDSKLCALITGGASQDATDKVRGKQKIEGLAKIEQFFLFLKWKLFLRKPIKFVLWWMTDPLRKNVYVEFQFYGHRIRNTVVRFQYRLRILYYMNGQQFSIKWGDPRQNSICRCW